MHDKLFESALGIQAPWSITGVRFDEAAKLLTLQVERIKLNTARQWSSSSDAMARRHHAPGDEPAGVHASAAALAPHPRLYLIRFHGVMAPNAKLRALVVPQGPAPSARSRMPPQIRPDAVRACCRGV